MRKIITLLIMALLLTGAADAKVKKHQNKKKRQTTTATTRNKSGAYPLPPQRKITDRMLSEALVDRSRYERALKGDAEEQYSIASSWKLGNFGKEDDAEALRWYYLAAQQGYAEAEYEVGSAYEDPFLFDDSIVQNYFEAAKWFARAYAHAEDNSFDGRLVKDRAAFDLGLMLHYGKITDDEFRIANELANNDVEATKRHAIAAYEAVPKRSEAQRQEEEAQANLEAEMRSYSALEGVWHLSSNRYKKIRITLYPSSGSVKFELWVGSNGVQWVEYPDAHYVSPGQIYVNGGYDFGRVTFSLSGNSLVSSAGKTYYK